MDYHINDTAAYHKNGMESLGWELTVCNMLEPAQSPARKVLREPGPFGGLLFNFIKKHADVSGVKKIIEIGGGYGYLMRDFLGELDGVNAVMVDISPFLLAKQKETLMDFDVTFLERDFFAIDAGFFSGADLVIFNENAGDFRTAWGLSRGLLYSENEQGGDVVKIRNAVKKYSLAITESNYAINIGAIEALEKVCSAGAGIIYISEHSCEAVVPDDMRKYIKISPAGNPEKISLRGHDEYTLRFSDLEKAGRYYGYTIIRGQYIDFLQVEFDGLARFVLSSCSLKDEHEIIRHFIEDLYKYEYLLMIKKG